MKVALEKSFPMPGPADIAWSFLQDIPGVAACMPGAQLTERVDEKHYKGTVTIKLGPASMSFRGEIEVVELDLSQRSLHLRGKGSDTSGSSGASLDLVARIEPGAAEGNSNLVGRSEVTVSGKAAAFGGRMMGTVADHVLKQFAGNFSTQVLTRAAASEVANACSASTAGSVSTADSAATVGAAVTTDPSAADPADKLNALTLFWGVLRDWFRGLFRRKAA
jgi:carbon monoxide dehydrogenase subunit G